MDAITNYKEITLEYMMNYIDSLPASKQAEAKADFKAHAFTKRHHRKAVKMFDTAGNPIMKQAKDKDGNLKFTKDGKPMMTQAKQMVDVEGDEVEVFSLLKAQAYFVETYMPDLKPAKKATKAKASDALKNW